MKTRFYFTYHNPKSLRDKESVPARLVVHDIDKNSHPKDWVIDCEISTNGQWGVLGNWQKAESCYSDYEPMLIQALEKLAAQYYRAALALREVSSYDKFDSLRIPVASGWYVKFKPCESQSEIRSWLFDCYLDWDSPTQQYKEMDDCQLYSHIRKQVGWQVNDSRDFLRGAIVRRLKAEAELKRLVGLKEGADFHALELRLKRLGEQMLGCQSELPTSSFIRKTDK